MCRGPNEPIRRATEDTGAESAVGLRLSVLVRIFRAFYLQTIQGVRGTARSGVNSNHATGPPQLEQYSIPTVSGFSHAARVAIRNCIGWAMKKFDDLTRQMP